MASPPPSPAALPSTGPAPAAAPPPTDLAFEGKGGVRLAGRVWLPAGRPRAAVALVPGISDHGERYPHLVEALAGAGLAVAALDTRGQGRSEGPRGHVARFDDFVHDLDRFVARVLGDLEPARRALFVFGHSMGGLIVLRWLAAGYGAAASVRGAIVSAPPLRVVAKAPRWKVVAAHVLSRIYPSLPLANEIDPAVVARDPEAVRRYREDPLVHGRVTPRLYTELLAAAARTFVETVDFRVPLFLFHGTADRIVDPAATRAYFDRLPIAEKSLRFYEGAYHEVHNDLPATRAALLADLLAWIEPRLAPASAEPA